MNVNQMVNWLDRAEIAAARKRKTRIPLALGAHRVLSHQAARRRFPIC